MSTFGERGGDTTEGGSATTETQEVLIKMWREVLKLESVGIHDGFLDLGGHSLSATLCINRIRQAFGVELPLDVFFMDPNDILNIAAEIDGLKRPRS